MKPWLLGGLVVAGLVAAALVLRGRDRLPETPEAAVAAFFDAAGRGDDAAYLRLVSGRLLESLRNTRAEAGAAAFRESLKQSTKGITGHAVSRSDELPPEGVLLDVEIVFADRNQRQRMLLKPQGNGWVIASIETAQVVEPPIAYGTPVFEEPPPEGNEASSP